MFDEEAYRQDLADTELSRNNVLTGSMRTSHRPLEPDIISDL